MKIIALKGHGSSGKTSSLIELYELLKIDRNYNESVAKQNVGSEKDFCAKFTNNVTHKEIAIYSEGDSPKSIEQAISKFDTLNENDILVLACRTKGKVLKVLRMYDPIYIKKSTTYYEANTKNFVNKSDAQYIKSIL